MTRTMILDWMRIGLDSIRERERGARERLTNGVVPGIARAQYEPTMPVNGGGEHASRRRVSGETRERASTSGAEAANANANANANARDESYANRENDGGRSGNKDRVRPMMVDETPVKRVKTARGGAKTPASVGRRTAESAKTAPVKGDGATAQTPRVRPTNNQLLYRINFKWEHYEHAIPAHVRKALPKMTEACPSVTSAFLQTCLLYTSPSPRDS